MLYSWPGNVRELEHTIERAVIFCESSQLSESDIVLPVGKVKGADSFQQAKAKIIEQFEREYIQRLLVSCNGNISRAAQAAKKKPPRVLGADAKTSYRRAESQAKRAVISA
jgi:DNA-binding NtrC family response regulator